MHSLDANRRIQIPPVTLNLLAINMLCYLAQQVLPRVDIDLMGLLGLHYVTAHDFHVRQPIGYMPLHGSFTHLFFDMSAPLTFGTMIEWTWGAKRFLLSYLVCKLTIALSQELVWGLMTAREVAGYDTVAFLDSPCMATTLFVSQLLTTGTSEAVFGFLLAFGWLYLNAAIYLFFIPIPIKVKYFVIGYGVIELSPGVTNIESDMAHFTHLGGILGDLLLMLLWREQGKLYDASGETYKRY